MTLKYLAHWQPLKNEDAHTALVFGFLRHAPTSFALEPWLSQVLETEILAQPLTQASFWPTFPSATDASKRTEPDLVIRVEENRTDQVAVVVEVKPGYGQHTLEQSTRELLDVASHLRTPDVALVLVGADLGMPSVAGDWETKVLEAAGSAGVTLRSCRVRYSSFRDIATVIRECTNRAPEWGQYAHDVISQLKRKALLGYEGAPLLDDLTNVNVRNVVEGFNRVVKEARQFFLQLHGRREFTDLSLLPGTGTSFSMRRDGQSKSLTEQEGWFETTTILALYRRATWQKGQLVFVTFNLLGDADEEIAPGSEEPAIEAGACMTTGEPGQLQWWYGKEVEDATLTTPAMIALDKEMLPYESADGDTEWAYDSRPWRPGRPDEDLAWAVSRLTCACETWSTG